jgi:hypothetical protein
MLDSTSSSTRRIAIPAPEIHRARLNLSTQSTLPAHRGSLDERLSRERPCRFRATSPRTCRDPSGSIDLDPSDLPGLKNIVHVMFSRSRGASNAGCSIACARNDAASRSQLGGEELPNCFLEHRRMGRPLPCTIRLRAQRSDHMAVVRCQSARQLDMRCAPHTCMVALRGKTNVHSSFD